MILYSAVYLQVLLIL